MRIAFWVRTGNKYGSLEKYIALFAEMCKDHGHTFILFNEIENTSEEFRWRLANAGAEQIVVGESFHSPKMVFLKTLSHIRKWKPDVVQLHFINSLMIPFLKLNGAPLVYQTYHSSIDHKISLQTKILRQLDNIFATRVFAVSDQILKDEIHAGVNPNHIEKMYLGLRMSDFEGQNLIPQEPEPSGWHDLQRKIVITIGRFYPVKGMRYVVEAAVQILLKRKDIVWWLVGREGPESEYCNQIVVNAGLQRDIIFLGQRNDIPALLFRSDFQVVGPLSEGLGLMALEAAACGVPTIGTQIGGLDEAIIDGVTGLLVKSRSSKAIIKATNWMIDNPDQKKMMGLAAKKHVAKIFNSEHQISRLLELFAQDYRTKLNHEE